MDEEVKGREGKDGEGEEIKIGMVDDGATAEGVPRKTMARGFPLTRPGLDS